jgi:hypothetical protein
MSRTRFKKHLRNSDEYDIESLFDSYYDEDPEDFEESYLTFDPVMKYTDEEGFEEYEDLSFLDEFDEEVEEEIYE